MFAESSFSYTFHPEVWLLIAFCVWLGYFVSRKLAPQLERSAAPGHPATSPRQPESAPRHPRQPRHPAITPKQKLCYAAGVFFLWLASDWPLHDLSEDYLYSVHMIQHLLITFVVPPLLLMSVPEALARVVFGTDNKVLRRLTHPVVAGVSFNMAVALTHLPWVVNTAADNGAFHYVVHTVLFGLALLMWMPVCGPLREFRLGLPGQMVYLFAMSILPTVPAGFLTFAESPIYEAYTGAFGIEPDSDQQAAGLIMKIVGGFYLWVIIAVLFFKWSAQQESDNVRVRRAPGGASGSALSNLTEIVLKEKAGGYSSFCPELPVASQGETEEEASAMLLDAIVCFLDGGGQPAWDGEREREDIAEWSQEGGMKCVYDGALRLA